MFERIQNKVGVVVMAAGKGTRLKTTTVPKVMLPIGGRPMVDYTVSTLEQVGFSSDRLCLVVGYEQQIVRDYFGARVTYVSQAEQLGTAHAAYVGMKQLPVGIEQVLVLGGGDSAFYTPETLRSFISDHCSQGATISVLTVDVVDPSALGRVVRGEAGECLAILEKEQVSEAEKSIREVSTGTYCINRRWFEIMFPTMPKTERLGEYGLNDAVKIAIAQKLLVRAVKLTNSDEWFGINAPEELAEGDRRKKLGSKN